MGKDDGSSGMPQFEKVYAYVMNELLARLDSRLYYHGIHHTRDDVLPAAERLAAMANVEGEDLLLLRTGVLYHDVGCVEDYFNHEQVGVKIATETLPSFGYTPGQIEVVNNIIRTTQLPQNPQNFLEELMCDADLDSLGREDFFITCHQLRLELKEYGRPTTVREWYIRELKFLSSHQYFTEFARTLWSEVKQQNIDELKDVLGM